MTTGPAVGLQATWPSSTTMSTKALSMTGSALWYQQKIGFIALFFAPVLFLKQTSFLNKAHETANCPAHIHFECCHSMSLSSSILGPQDRRTKYNIQYITLNKDHHVETIERRVQVSILNLGSLAYTHFGQLWTSFMQFAVSQTLVA